MKTRKIRTLAETRNLTWLSADDTGVCQVAYGRLRIDDKTGIATLLLESATAESLEKFVEDNSLYTWGVIESIHKNWDDDQVLGYRVYVYVRLETEDMLQL